MARVQILMSDEDRERFVYQAKREGMTLSAWLRLAARERLKAKQKQKPFESVEELEEFFRQSDERRGDGVEPDWEDHLKVINESKMRGLPEV